MPTSVILVQGTFRTPSSLFIVFSFSNIESSLLFMPVLAVPHSTQCFIKSMKNIMTNLIQIGSTMGKWKVGKLLKTLIRRMY